MCTELYIPNAVYDSISLITKTHVNVTKAALPTQANSCPPTQHLLRRWYYTIIVHASKYHAIEIVLGDETPKVRS